MLLHLALCVASLQTSRIDLPGVWRVKFTVVESGFEKGTTESIKQQSRKEAVMQNKGAWSIRFTPDHTYTLQGEKGKWWIKDSYLWLGATHRGGRKMKKPGRQAYVIAASGKSFGLQLRSFYRLDYTKVEN